MQYETGFTGSINLGSPPGVLFDLDSSWPAAGNWVITGKARDGKSINLLSFLQLLLPSVSANNLPVLNLDALSVADDKTNQVRILKANSSNAFTWDKPFGIEEGLSVTDLAITVINPQQGGMTAFFKGSLSVLLKSGPPLTVNIYSYFSRGKLALLLADNIPVIDIGDVFNHFFGSVVTWPTSLVDISFSNSRIYYALSANPVPDTSPGTVYVPIKGTISQGLNISTEISFSLADTPLPPVLLNANINTVTKGILINATLPQPVNVFDFLSITDQQYATGPTLSIDSVNKSMQFGCGIVMGKDHLGTASLSVTMKDGNRMLSAIISPNLGLLPFLNVSNTDSWTFTWTAKDGLQIGNLPFASLGNILQLADFAKYIESMANTGGCNIALDLVNNVLSSQVIAKPSFATKLPDGYSMGGSTANFVFYILLEGYYKVSCGDVQVVTVDLPKLALGIPAPTSFSFDGIMNMLVKIVTDNMQTVVAQLWNDKQALGKFLLVFAGKEALQNLAKNMICDLGDTLKEFVSDLGNAAISTVGDALSAVGSAVTSMGGACGGGGGNNNNNNNNNGGGGAGPGNTWSSVVLTAPQISKPVFNNSNTQLLFAFPNTQNQPVQGYEYQWLAPTTDNGSTPSLVEDKIILQTDFQAPIAFDVDATLSGPYTFQAKYLAPADGLDVDSNFNVVQLVKLASPQNVTTVWNQQQQTVTVSWAAAAAQPGLYGYCVRVLAGANGNWTPLAQKMIVNAMQAVFHVPGDFVLPASGQLQGQVCAKTTNDFNSRINGTTIDSRFINSSQPVNTGSGIGYMQVGVNFIIA